MNFDISQLRPILTKKHEDEYQEDMRRMLMSSIKQKLKSMFSEVFEGHSSGIISEIEAMEKQGLVSILVDCLKNKDTVDDENNVYIIPDVFETLTHYVSIKRDSSGIPDECFDELIYFLESGLTTHQYTAATFLRMFFIFDSRKSLEESETLMRIVDLLFQKLDMSPQTLIDELNDVHQTGTSSLQTDVIRPNLSIEDGVDYAPRYVCMLEENALFALSYLFRNRARLPEGSMIFLRKFGPKYLSKLMDIASSPFLEAYPESPRSKLASEILSYLTHACLKNQFLYEESLKMMIDAGLIPTISKALDILYTENYEEDLPKRLSFAAFKYKSEMLPDESMLASIAQKRISIRAYLLGIVLFLSRHPKFAREVLPLLHQLHRDLDMFLIVAEKSPESQNQHELGYSICEGEHCANLVYGQENQTFHFSPTPVACILLIFKNLSSQGYDISKTKSDFVPKQRDWRALEVEKAMECKREGNEKFKEKDFRIAAFWYTTALEFGPEKDLECILYSNRSECHLQLSEWDHALRDAEHAYSLDPKHEKSLTRMQRAKKKKLKK